MTAKTLDAARQDFAKVLDEHEESFDFVIELSVPPEGMDPELWPEDARSLLESTLDVLTEQGQPMEAVAILLHNDGGAEVVHGTFTGGGETTMYSIGEAGFDDAGDLDALAVAELEGDPSDMAAFAEYL